MKNLILAVAMNSIAAFPLYAAAEQTYPTKLENISAGCEKVAASKLQAFKAAEKASGAGSAEWFAAHESMKSAVGKCVDEGIVSGSYVYRDEVDRHPLAKHQLEAVFRAWTANLKGINADAVGFTNKAYELAVDELKSPPYGK